MLEDTIQRAAARLLQQPPARIVGAAVACYAVTAYLDYLTGYDLSLSFFYLPPVALTAWAAGTNSGMGMALACAVSEGLVLARWGVPVPILAWNTFVRLLTYAVVVMLLKALKDAFRREQAMARLDSLTGIGNRRYFSERLHVEAERAHRSGEPIVIAYLDLDNFKEVNDRFGHEAGDSLLRGVASALSGSVRTTDVVARMGGDEFALALAGMSDDSARRMLEKIHSVAVESVEGAPCPVGVSIGAIVFRGQNHSPDEMLRSADTLMYEVKKDGKGQVRLADGPDLPIPAP